MSTGLANRIAALFPPAVGIACGACILLAAVAGKVAGAEVDPFNTGALYAAGPGDSRGGKLRMPCQKTPDGVALALADIVEASLCNNPQTRLAWVNARIQAAQLGVSQSAFLPTLSASAAHSRNSSNATGPQLTYNQTSASLSANYLLYDFGGREATLENARQLMAALAATQDATLQSVFLSAVQAYYQRYAVEAAATAARESVRASQESLKAAEARYRVGTGTPADRLQAQTAASQAALTLIQAEGNAQTALGVLANVMGLDANSAPAIAAPADIASSGAFERNISELIAEAKRARPDLSAAEAQVKAAHANIAAVNASGMPSIALFATRNYSDNGSSAALRGNTLGISMNIPLFTGYNTTYRVKAAEAQLEAKTALLDQLSKQVSLDVWRAYYALITGTEALRASADLLASAEESEKLAAGRYKAGVGGILELLNAQSALASARQQNIQAFYNWRIAKTALAQAMGQLDVSELQTAAK
ncbi:MAG: TolC family protein [Sterolibacterium sp.]|nr:TolC family protein [Sterolibacterium sp.]